MSLRAYLDQLLTTGTMLQIEKPVSKQLQAAGILKALEPQPVLFNSIKESGFPVMGNLCCTKQSFADYLGIPVESLIPTLTRAIDHPGRPELITDPPARRSSLMHPIWMISLFFSTVKAMAGTISAPCDDRRPPRLRTDMDFHRCMQFSKTEMAVRVVKTRHFDTFLQDLGAVDVAICVGVAPNILVAAATSVEIGVDELGIAHALEPFPSPKQSLPTS